MMMLTVKLILNGQTQTIPHAVTVEMDELAGLPLAEARRYVDDKVKQWVTQHVNYSWTVEQRALPVRETLAA
jgi:hypothetical protein